MGGIRGTQYAEVEAYIVQYAIQYELAGPGTALGNDAKSQLVQYTGTWIQAQQWLVQRHWSYGSEAFYSREIHGTGNWRDTLLELGFSAATVRFIDAIP
jgi:hypothetical protein